MTKYIFKYKGLFILRCFTKIVSSILSIALAFLFQYIIDTISKGNMKELEIVLLVSVGYLVICFINKNLDGYLDVLFLQKTMVNIKNNVFTKIMQKDMNDFISHNSGEYIATLTNDSKIIEDDLISNIFILVESVFTFLLSVVVLLKISIPMTIAVFCIGAITILIPNLFNKALVKNKTQYSKDMEKFISTIKDFLSGFEVIKSFNISNKIISAFSNSNEKVEESKKKYSKSEIISSSVGSLLGNSLFLFIMFFSGYLVIKKKYAIGIVVECTQLMNYITGTLISTVPIINRMKSTNKIVGKFKNILYENKCEIEYKGLKNINKNIVFENVDFSYDNKTKIIHNFNFTFEKGKKYAIIGESGCGKSTIIKLLMGYYRNYIGNISIDEEEFKNIDLNDYYKLISIISQNVFVFDSSIQDNITLFSDYSSEEIEKVLQKSDLINTINKKSEGLQTKVSESGFNLSGGEKQRIAIARSLLKKVSILVLDEATSALDNKTAYEIENCILNIPNITSIVVTHKLCKEILQKYDDIIVMKNGTIIETGKFNDLINKKEYFYSIYNVEKFS